MSTPMSSPKSLGVSEFYGTDTDRHSTLEPVQADHSTLEAVPYRADEDGYGAKHAVVGKHEGPYNDLEGGTGGEQGGFWKRRVCGMSMVVIVIVLTIVILGLVGGGVGGALASKNSKDTTTKDNAPLLTPVSTVVNGNGQTITITATGTVKTETTIDAPSSTSTKSTPLPPYPTKDLAANLWYKIGTPRLAVSTQYQLEARWADLNALGSIGLTPNSTETDQTWQLLAVPQSNENAKRVYENEVEAGGLTSLYYIACLRFGQQVRMVIDNADVERYKDGGGTGKMQITMARANDKEAGQYWWLDEKESKENTKTFKVYNLKAGKNWGLRASMDGEGNGMASMVSILSGEKEGEHLWDVTKEGGKIGSQDGWFIYD